MPALGFRIGRAAGVASCCSSDPINICALGISKISPCSSGRNGLTSVWPWCQSRWFFWRAVLIASLRRTRFNHRTWPRPITPIIIIPIEATVWRCCNCGDGSCNKNDHTSANEYIDTTQYAKTMPTRIDVPHRIVEHVTIAIELLRVAWSATPLAPRSCCHRIIRRNRQRPCARNNRICRNESPEGWIIITGTIVRSEALCRIRMRSIDAKVSVHLKVLAGMHANHCSTGSERAQKRLYPQ